MIRRPPRSTLDRSSAASDVYKRQRVSWPADAGAGGDSAHPARVVGEGRRAGGEHQARR